MITLETIANKVSVGSKVWFRYQGENEINFGDVIDMSDAIRVRPEGSEYCYLIVHPFQIGEYWGLDPMGGF